MKAPQKQAFEALAVSRLHLVASLRDSATAMRDAYAEEYGDAGFPNRFPVSGGICDHWPREAKDAICRIVRDADKARDESLQLWKRSGRRLETWKRKREEIIPGPFSA